jgi:hypothetical protein
MDACFNRLMSDSRLVEPSAFTGQIVVVKRRVAPRGQEHPFFQSVDQQPAPPDHAMEG